jgi:hypothetical protein
VAALDIYELPSARGCTYVVPGEHFGLALQVGRGAPEGDLRTLAKLGVDRSEIDELCGRVLAALDEAPQLDPAALKDVLGETVRYLGEEGRKRGQSTTLPAALGLLQAAGEIRRVPANGPLDNQRYAYTRWQPPSSGVDSAGARTELARRYFDWIGPARRRAQLQPRLAEVPGAAAGGPPEGLVDVLELQQVHPVDRVDLDVAYPHRVAVVVPAVPHRQHR